MVQIIHRKFSSIQVRPAGCQSFYFCQIQPSPSQDISPVYFQAQLEARLLQRGGQFLVGNNLTWDDIDIFKKNNPLVMQIISA